MALTEEQILRAKKELYEAFEGARTLFFPRITYELRPDAKPVVTGYTGSHLEFNEIDYLANMAYQTGLPAIHLKHER